MWADFQSVNASKVFFSRSKSIIATEKDKKVVPIWGNWVPHSGNRILRLGKLTGFPIRETGSPQK